MIRSLRPDTAAGGLSAGSCAPLKLLVLRPEGGAEATAARAVAAGFGAVVAPLFGYAALGWEPPGELPEALLLTSAAAVRFGGAQLGALASVPVWAVGEATAAAAREAGFRVVQAGRSDAEATVAAMTAAGVGHALHVAGREHRAVAAPGLRIDRVPVYAAEPVAALPDRARVALDEGAVALLHSPRAAEWFGRLLDASGRARYAVRIACFSAAVAAAAGSGWRAVAVAKSPTDSALFAAAAGLCDHGAP